MGATRARMLVDAFPPHVLQHGLPSRAYCTYRVVYTTTWPAMQGLAVRFVSEALVQGTFPSSPLAVAGLVTALKMLQYSCCVLLGSGMLVVEAGSGVWAFLGMVIARRSRDQVHHVTEIKFP